MDRFYVPYRRNEACEFMPFADPEFPVARDIDFQLGGSSTFDQEARHFAVRLAHAAGCTVGDRGATVSEAVAGWKRFADAGGNNENKSGGYLGLSHVSDYTIYHGGVPVVVFSAIVSIEKDNLELHDERHGLFHRCYNDIRVLRALRRAYLDDNPDLCGFPRIIGHAVAMSKRNTRARARYVHVGYVATRAGPAHGPSAGPAATLMSFLRRPEHSHRHKRSAVVQAIALQRLMHALGIGHGDPHSKNVVVWYPSDASPLANTSTVATTSGKSYVIDGPCVCLLDFELAYGSLDADDGPIARLNGHYGNVWASHSFGHDLVRFARSVLVFFKDSPVSTNHDFEGTRRLLLALACNRQTPNTSILSYVDSTFPRANADLLVDVFPIAFTVTDDVDGCVDAELCHLSAAVSVPSRRSPYRRSALLDRSFERFFALDALSFEACRKVDRIRILTIVQSFWPLPTRTLPLAAEVYTDADRGATWLGRIVRGDVRRCLTDRANSTDGNYLQVHDAFANDDDAQLRLEKRALWKLTTLWMQTLVLAWRIAEAEGETTASITREHLTAAHRVVLVGQIVTSTTSSLALLSRFNERRPGLLDARHAQPVPTHYYLSSDDKCSWARMCPEKSNPDATGVYTDIQTAPKFVSDIVERFASVLTRERDMYAVTRLMHR